ATARPVLDHERLPQVIRKPLAGQACQDVERAARRRWHHDADWPRRIGLRGGEPQQRWKGDGGGCKAQRSAAGGGSCGAPEVSVLGFCLPHYMEFFCALEHRAAGASPGWRVGATFESGPFHCGCGRVYRAPQTSAEGAALTRIWRKP